MNADSANFLAKLLQVLITPENVGLAFVVGGGFWFLAAKSRRNGDRKTYRAAISAIILLSAYAIFRAIIKTRNTE